MNITKGNVNQLKQAIAFYGPVSILINTQPKSFKFYGSGIYYDQLCCKCSVDWSFSAFLSCVFVRADLSSSPERSLFQILLGCLEAACSPLLSCVSFFLGLRKATARKLRVFRIIWPRWMRNLDHFVDHRGWM